MGERGGGGGGERGAAAVLDLPPLPWGFPPLLRELVAGGVGGRGAGAGGGVGGDGGGGAAAAFGPLFCRLGVGALDVEDCRFLGGILMTVYSILPRS